MRSAMKCLCADNQYCRVNKESAEQRHRRIDRRRQVVVLETSVKGDRQEPEARVPFTLEEWVDRLRGDEEHRGDVAVAGAHIDAADLRHRDRGHPILAQPAEMAEHDGRAERGYVGDIGPDPFDDAHSNLPARAGTS